MVGGFSASPYLLNKVKNFFEGGEWPEYRIEILSLEQDQSVDLS